MHDLLKKIAGATEGTHLVPVLLVIEEGSISIEPIENLNERLSAITHNAKGDSSQTSKPVDLPIKEMKEALSTENSPITPGATLRSNSHFSLAFKQFCYDLMRDGASPEELHARLITGEVTFDDPILRVPCLSTLARWNQAGITRSRKKSSRRKRVNFDKKLHADVVAYYRAHPKTTAAAVGRRFNISSTSVWRWVNMAEEAEKEATSAVSTKKPAKSQEVGKVILKEATTKIVEKIDETASNSEESQYEDFFSFVKEDPTLKVETLKELFDVPVETLGRWMVTAKRTLYPKGKGINPRDKYTDAERKEFSQQFATRVKSGESYSQASEKVGVTRSVLVRWCKTLGISLKRSGPTSKKTSDTIEYLQFCIAKRPKEWTKLSQWLMVHSTSKEKARFAKQCEEMASQLKANNIPSRSLSTACFRHWSNAEAAMGFRP